MRHAWQGLPHHQVPTKGTSLWRLASGVIRAASLVSWNGTPTGESRTSCSRDPRRGGEHLSSTTFLGGRLRCVLAGDRCALEHRTWQGWQTDLLRALRRDGHCVPRVRRSSPEGPILIKIRSRNTVGAAPPSSPCLATSISLEGERSQIVLLLLIYIYIYIYIYKYIYQPSQVR